MIFCYHVIIDLSFSNFLFSQWITFNSFLIGRYFMIVKKKLHFFFSFSLALKGLKIIRVFFCLFCCCIDLTIFFRATKCNRPVNFEMTKQNKMWNISNLSGLFELEHLNRFDINWSQNYLSLHNFLKYLIFSLSLFFKNFKLYIKVD